ncbi:hypothetical protein FRC01_006059 [Tulasnella sp. 417]|nr:hypothetical protein FRC01_006059 [Tulasnella sp. 417]
MSIDTLPPEILIRILYYLPLQDIASFNLASKFCHDVVSTNETTVYQAAAMLHDFIGSPGPQSHSTLLMDSVHQPDATGWLENVTSWKEFCKRHFLRECAWTGMRLGNNSPEPLSLNMPLPSILNNVHRFKVDEVERTVICSTAVGGLLVVSIDTEEVLWQLPKRYVSPYAHVEFDRGFIVFTRRDNAVEVWRRSADSFKRNTYLTCNPAFAQVVASPYPVPRFPENFPPIFDEDSLSRRSRDPPPSLPRRGVYLPFALLNPPARTRASRFVYPHLLLASEASRKAYIWDIPTSSLIQTIEISPPPQPETLGLPEVIYYVELNQEFVFVCWSFSLVVHRRVPDDRSGEPPKDNVAFSVRLDSMTEADPARSFIGSVPCPIFSVDLPSPTKLGLEASVPQTSVAARYPVTQVYTQVDNGTPLLWEDFAAVHVSPHGRDLVTVTQGGWLLYVPDFEDQSPSARTRSPFKIYFSYHEFRTVEYLAFDGKRILLALVSAANMLSGAHLNSKELQDSGIYAITLRDFLHPREPQIDIQVRQLATVPPALRPEPGSRVSCLQLHSGSAWFTYTIFDDDENGGGNLAYVDLTASANQPSEA